MVLVYLISEASLVVEGKMSLIEEQHKQRLLQYRDRADQLVQTGRLNQLRQWLQALQAEHDTFATVVQLEHRELVGLEHPSDTQVIVRLGRQLDWPIHLHHTNNPTIELPLSDGTNYLVFQLPDAMMPGQYWPHIHKLLHLMFPMLSMALLSFFIYRHLMQPLSKLERATRKFSVGEYETRVAPELNGRSDELGLLARTFDEMAARVGSLVQTQRHLINDLSHELRTPLQRLELCIETDKSGNYQRLKREAALMRKLVEDTLTLAWLENEAPSVRHEPVDLVGLLEAIADDTRFEYQDRRLVLQLPDDLVIEDSSEKALNMALENIIRNAMRYTPSQGAVQVRLQADANYCQIDIQDQGPGVAQQYLNMIFKPFFRVDKSRERDAGGFGLGLALAKRQLEGLAGQVMARNLDSGGLQMSVRLPLSKATSM